MNKYMVKFENYDTSKYNQISLHIKKLIDMNEIKDGEKLPSIRKLSQMLNVNNVTIVNAYKKLETEGYAIQKVGSGTYAKRKEVTVNFKKKYAEELRKISKRKLREYIDFSGEAVCSEFFSIDAFKDIINEVLDRDGTEALIYQEALGYEGLRSRISEFFWDSKVKNDDILIVSGAQQGIDIVSKALINVNDNVLIEKPTYGGALSVFKARRANIFEVELDEDGINLNQLEKIVKKNKIKCIYLMSYFQNPTGTSYSLQKKKAILNMAEIYDFYIIEDDYLSELIYNNDIEYKSFKSLDVNDRVIYIKSFSKVFLPGIRLGYMISPKVFKEIIQNSKINTDIATSSLMQRALDLYISKGLWRDHICKLNSIYKNRYKFMKKYLKDELKDKVQFKNPGGGLNFYIKIKEECKIGSMELFYKCKMDKVLITPGVLFYKNSVDGNKYFRLGFSQLDEKNIRKGVDIIKKIIE